MLFYQNEISNNEEAQTFLAGEHIPELLNVFKEQLANLEDWEASKIKEAISATQKETQQKGKNLFMPIRVATTGQLHGPELTNSIHLMGISTVIKIGRA